MTMIPRLHLFEWEDQPWFPTVIRDLATDYLHFVETKFALHRPVVGLLAEALCATGLRHVVDLCSGGGGPIPSLKKELGEQGLTVSFLLTDKYPNLGAFEAMAASSNGEIAFRTDPVDAMAVPRDAVGFRTLFNALHHFHPADALAVLRDAATAGQPIGVFESVDRRVRTILPMLFLVPLVVVVTTPFIRPFRWSRLFWTYVVPLVPFAVWWDGIVSQLRAYTVPELERLAADVGVPGYVWKAGHLPIGTAPGRLTYLMGFLCPK